MHVVAVDVVVCSESPSVETGVVDVRTTGVSLGGVMGPSAIITFLFDDGGLVDEIFNIEKVPIVN